MMSLFADGKEGREEGEREGGRKEGRRIKSGNLFTKIKLFLTMK